jgi:hypothetical protein
MFRFAPSGRSGKRLDADKSRRGKIIRRVINITLYQNLSEKFFELMYLQ